MIRRARSSDVESIMKIGQQLLAPPNRGVIEQICSLPDASLFVFEDENHIVAFLHFSVIEAEAEIIDIAVDEFCHRQGIGSALLKHLRQALPNLQKIFLEVSERNQVAREFYNKLGFRQVAVRKGYYRDGSDALVMSISFPQLENNL